MKKATALDWLDTEQWMLIIKTAMIMKTAIVLAWLVIIKAVKVLDIEAISGSFI